MLLRFGRLSEAAAVLEGRFDMEDGSHAAAVLDAAGVVALGKLAIHTGDRRELRRLTDIANVMFDGGTPGLCESTPRGCAPWPNRRRATTRLLTGWLRAPAEASAGILPPRFPLDVGDEVLLARIALAAHDDDLGRLARDTTSSRAAQNPGVQSIAVIAAHVRGLVEGDVHALREAADLFEDRPDRWSMPPRSRTSARTTPQPTAKRRSRLWVTRSRSTAGTGNLGRTPRAQPAAHARRAPPHRDRRA